MVRNTQVPTQGWSLVILAPLKIENWPVGCVLVVWGAVILVCPIWSHHCLLYFMTNIKVTNLKKYSWEICESGREGTRFPRIAALPRCTRTPSRPHPEVPNRLTFLLPRVAGQVQPPAFSPPAQPPHASRRRTPPPLGGKQSPVSCSPPQKKFSKNSILPHTGSPYSKKQYCFFTTLADPPR